MSSPLTFHRPQHGVAWQEWSPGAFDAARASTRPLLLFLTVPWSEPCAVLAAQLAAESALAAFITQHFVPVRVDAERRPDIGDRYDAGGWPTLAFLTADGEVLTATTDSSPESIQQLCQRVVDAVRSRRGEFASTRRPSSGVRLTPQISRPDPVIGFVALVHEQFDEVHAGFGHGPKFPHAAALRALCGYLASRRGAQDQRVREIVRRSVDALDALHDPAEGGVFRHARGADWSDPVGEKLLDDQAALVDVYVAAAEVLGESRYLARAADIVQFATSRLADPQAGFAGSVRDDIVDPTLYVDANAHMAAALLRVASASRDEELARNAVTGLERVVLAAHRPGQGVAHWAASDGAGSERLLRDQVAVADAMLAAHQVGGNETHLMMAEELMLGALRQHWNADAWMFRDAAPKSGDIGLLARPRYPLDVNADAVRVLTILAERAGKREYKSRALDVLRAFALTSHEHGLLAAPYVSAMLLIK